MSKKHFFIIALQVIVIGAFTMLAVGSGGGSSSSMSYQDAYNAGYEIGHGIGTLINN